MIEPFKYLLQPVAIERNGEGRVVREIPGEVLSVYSLEQAIKAIQGFEDQLVELQMKAEEEKEEGVVAHAG